MKDNPQNWKLFKLSLLQIGNSLRPVPLSYDVHTTEAYRNMKLLQKAAKHEDHQWQICGDLKVIPVLLRMQLHPSIAT